MAFVTLHFSLSDESVSCQPVFLHLLYLKQHRQRCYACRITCCNLCQNYSKNYTCILILKSICKALFGKLLPEQGQSHMAGVYKNCERCPFLPLNENGKREIFTGRNRSIQVSVSRLLFSFSPSSCRATVSWRVLTSQLQFHKASQTACVIDTYTSASSSNVRHACTHYTKPLICWDRRTHALTKKKFGSWRFNSIWFAVSDGRNEAMAQGKPSGSLKVRWVFLTY